MGDIVNIENDVIGKYIERFSGYAKVKGTASEENKSESRITAEFLMKSGF